MVGGTLSPLALANKAESVVSVTSQCSFSSTIVHVGDKKPPESGMGVEWGVPLGAPARPPSYLPFPSCLAPSGGKGASIPTRGSCLSLSTSASLCCLVFPVLPVCSHTRPRVGGSSPRG